MFIVPDPLVGGLLTSIMSALGTITTGLVHCHLYSNDLSPTKDNVLADFTEMTSTQVPGYAVKSINWFAGVPFRRQDGAWEDPSSLVNPSFVATSAPPAPVVAYGIFLTDSTDAILLGSGRFATLFTFQAIGDGFSLPGNPSLLQSDGNTLTVTLADLEPM